MVSPVSIKPGFGKAPDIPKTLSSKSSGGKNVTASQSSLKSSATQTIKTSTVSTECRSRASSSSSNFVPGQRPIEFVRDRTVTVPHGAFASAGGKYQLESDMGMTKRSTERLLKQQAEMQKQQQMAMLNQMNMMYGNRGVQQPQMSFGQFATELASMFSGLFGSSGAEKGGGAANAKAANTVISSDSNIAAMQNATTASDLSTAIEGAKGKVSELGGNITKAKGALQNLKAQTPGLQQTKDNADLAVKENKNSISQKQGEVQNNIQRESASQMAMNAAQSQVDMLKSQLASAGPMAKAGIEASLQQAEAQLKLKTEQYEQAVKAREQSQQDLESLQSQTPELENAASTAKADLEANTQQISSKESEVSNYETLQRDMNEVIGKQETRLEELKKKEGNDVKQ